MRTGRHREATVHVDAMQEANIASRSTRLALLAGASTALVSHDQCACEHFAAALAIPGAHRWPFDLARVHLLYGERLRRARATTESRRHLSAAFDTFERLSAQPWMTRTATELRAAGRDAPRGFGPHDADGAGTDDRALGHGRSHQQADRHAAVPLASHRRCTLVSSLSQAGITSRTTLRDTLGAAA